MKYKGHYPKYPGKHALVGVNEYQTTPKTKPQPENKTTFFDAEAWEFAKKLIQSSETKKNDTPPSPAQQEEPLKRGRGRPRKIAQ